MRVSSIMPHCIAVVRRMLRSWDRPKYAVQLLHQPGLQPATTFTTMADIQGVLGCVLHTARKVSDVVQTIKDAPNAIHSLGQEALRSRIVLAKVVPPQEGLSANALRSISAQDPQIMVLLGQARDLTAAAESLLAKTTTRAEDGSYRVKTRYRFSLADDAEKLSAKFATFYVSLTAMCAMSTSYVQFPGYSWSWAMTVGMPESSPAPT